MDNRASIQLVERLAKMNIHNEASIKDNRRYYHLHDSFPPVDHAELQKHFRAIAQDYLATFSGQDMRLNDDSFRESSLNGFDEMSFQYPDNNELVVDYLYDGSCRIFWLGTDKIFHSRGKLAFANAEHTFSTIA